MLDSVQPLLAEHASLQEQLSDAAVHQNPALAKKLNRRYAGRTACRRAKAPGSQRETSSLADSKRS